MRILLSVIFISVLIASCCECEDNDEPNAGIIFEQDSVGYFAIKGIDSDSIIEVYSDEYNFPLSIVSDTTTMIFYGTESTDTLSIKYKRDFSYEGKCCGFTVVLSDFQSLDLTTFDSVKFSISPSSYWIKCYK